MKSRLAFCKPLFEPVYFPENQDVDVSIESLDKNEVHKIEENVEELESGNERVSDHTMRKIKAERQMC